MMWFGASPEDPRSSAILFLLSLYLPTCWGGRRRSRRVGAGGWNRPASHLFCNKRIDLFRGQVVMKAVVQPHHRRELARAEAFDLLVAEQPVRRNLLRRADPDLLPHAVDNLVGAAQHAAEVRANVKPVLADRLVMEEAVKSRDPLDVSGVEVERRRHPAHRLGRQ